MIKSKQQICKYKKEIAMFEYIKKIQERMTENDKRLLSDIYAPQVVAVPDRDPWGRLTVMPDGRI